MTEKDVPDMKKPKGGNMKRLTVVLAGVLMMAATVPTLAQQVTKEEKDMCLLATKGCLNEADSIQKRIRRIQTEIKKGKKVYSADELKKLELKLKEAKEILDSLENENRP